MFVRNNPVLGGRARGPAQPGSPERQERTVMAQLSAAELKDFTDTVDGVVAAQWPNARAAGEDSDFSAVRSLWATAVQQGWTELASEGALDAVVAALGRLGRVACPLPLMDIYVAARL